MSTKYVINASGTRIKAHECVKETSQFACLKGFYFDPNKITKRKKAGVVFDTWAEAHAKLMRYVEANLAEARRTLLIAQSFADIVKGMKPPTPTTSEDPK